MENKNQKNIITDTTEYYTTLEVMKQFQCSMQSVGRYIEKGILEVAGYSRDTGSKLFKREQVRYLKPLIKFYYKYFVRKAKNENNKPTNGGNKNQNGEAVKYISKAATGAAKTNENQ